MFAIAEAMNFNHLPVPGGLYDQHPDLLDAWETIFRIKSQEEKKRQDKQMNDVKAKRGAKR